MSDLPVAPAIAQPAGAFSAAGNLITARGDHTATLLSDGRVLIAGGAGLAGTLSSAEVYDPSTGTFAATGNLIAARRGHSATLLSDGRVLIAGGYGGVLIAGGHGFYGLLASAEIFDPSTGTFATTGDLHSTQVLQAAVLLNNSKVLIAGGDTPPFGTAAPAELYDPGNSTFSLTGAYAATGSLYPTAGGPVLPTATPLSDGRILIAGDSTAQLFDPSTETFTVTGTMTTRAYGVYWHTATK